VIIHLMWVALAVVAVLAVLEVRSRDAMQEFLSPVMQRRLAARPSQSRIAARLGLIMFALAFGVIALTRPQATVTAQSVATIDAASDVVFVLDVSKSMLAEDARPNRLSRAKVEIAQMVEKLTAARVGLVAFAGRAVPMCPLTPDHAFFELVLSGVDTSSVSKGGTRIGEAIRTAIKSFPPGMGAKLIVLITDGEDHESYPVEAAKEARAAGIHIIAVGLGSTTGSPIMLTDPKTGAKTALQHDGAEVVSKLDAKTLLQMAEITDGVYIPAETSAINLDSILNEHIKPIANAAAAERLQVAPVEQYPWYVLACLGCLLAALWVGTSLDPPGARS
jgi:Ca-activated chloride channel homolog